MKNYEHDLLLKNPLTTHRYKANFKQATNLVKQFEINILQFSEGRMLGEYECIRDLPYTTSVVCIDQNASVLEITRENFHKLQEVSEEQWKDI